MLRRHLAVVQVLLDLDPDPDPDPDHSKALPVRMILMIQESFLLPIRKELTETAKKRRLVNWSKSVKRETKLDVSCEKRTKEIEDESRRARIGPRANAIRIEISPKKLLWGRLNLPLAMPCTTNVSSIRRLGFRAVSAKMTTIICMISLCLLIGLLPQSIKMLREIRGRGVSLLKCLTMRWTTKLDRTVKSKMC